MCIELITSKPYKFKPGGGATEQVCVLGLALLPVLHRETSTCDLVLRTNNE